MIVKRVCLITTLFFAIISLYLIIPESEELKYKETDVFSYYSYTDSDIKKAPRISGDYYFSYNPPDGGQREMSTITFTGGSPALLKNHLLKLGFKLYQVESNGQMEIWLSSDKQNAIFTLWCDAKLNVISLTKTIL